MNKNSLSAIIFISIFLSGCIKSTGDIKGESSDNSSFENINTEEFKSIYSNMEGTYLENMDIASICQDFQGKVSITNKTKEIEYTKKTTDILKNINSALGCEVSIPITIVDHDSYAAITRNDGVHLTKGIFENSAYIDEIAFIITHESTHYFLEHPKKMILKDSSLADEERRTTQALNNGISKSFLTEIFGKASNIITDNYPRAMNIEKTRAKKGLAIEHETQADLIGVDLLVKANYSPQALTYNFDMIRSCLDYQEGQLNVAFDSLQKQADELNMRNHSYSEFFDFLENTVNLMGDHSPVPWREQMIFTYIKVKHSNALRNEMIRNI